MNAAFEAEIRPHFNEPMIAVNEIVRCIGYAEDDSDCYVIIRRLGGEVLWHTMVGGYVFLNRLKGQGHVSAANGEEWDDLFRLDSVLKLNGCPPEPEFQCCCSSRQPQPSRSVIPTPGKCLSSAT